MCIGIHDFANVGNNVKADLSSISHHFTSGNRFSWTDICYSNILRETQSLERAALQNEPENLF